MPRIALLCSLALAAASSAQDAPRPNVLWISSEDNGPDLGCYGCPDADTPNLDAMAAEGIVYTRCWSNAPVCAPARTAIITGRHPPALGAEHMRSRVRLPDGLRMFPQHLREAGYYCSNNAKEDYNVAKPGKVWDESSRDAHWRKREPGQPFFAVFNLTVTHESQIRRRPHRQVHDPTTVRLPPYHPDLPEVRRDWAQYHDKMTEMDERAGAILRELERDGLAEDTIVFYWADHGAGLPGHKRTPKQTGLHVPLIVRVPERWRDHAGGEPGRSDRLVSFVDLGPTVLSLAGIATPATMHGRAFLGPRRAEPREYLHGYRARMDERLDLVRSVRDRRWLYVRNYMPWLPLGKHVSYMFETPTTRVWKAAFDRGELDDVQAAFWRPRAPEELYDLEADPFATRDLTGSGEHGAVLQRLRGEHRRHALAVGDLGLLPEADMLARCGDGAPYDLAHGDGAVDLERVLEVAGLASSLDPDAEDSLAEAVQDEDAAVRYWALVGLIHLGSEVFARHSAAFAAALVDPSPSVQVVAAEGLVRYGDDPGAALERLAALADRREAGLFVAVAAWNALDGLDQRAAPVRDALAAIPVDGAPRPFQNYLPRLRDKTLADLEGR